MIASTALESRNVGGQFKYIAKIGFVLYCIDTPVIVVIQLLLNTVIQNQEFVVVLF